MVIGSPSRAASAARAMAVLPDDASTSCFPLQRAAPGKALQQIGGGPVLDRAERVEPFELEIDVEVGRDAIEPDQGSGLIDVGQQLADVVVAADVAIGAEKARLFVFVRDMSSFGILQKSKNPHPWGCGRECDAVVGLI